MPRQIPTLVLVLSLALVLGAAGCIEVKDPPEEGEFTITMETEVVMYTLEGFARDLHGPHAEVESELHHEHPDYSWEIEGSGHLEGQDVHIDAAEVGLRRTTYHLEYYEEMAHLSMVLATIPDSTNTYVVVAKLPLEDGDLPDATELVIEPVTGLAHIHDEPMGSIMERLDNQTEVLVFSVSLAEDAEGPVSFVAGFYVSVGINAFRFDHGFVIHPGLHHRISYEYAGVNVSISNMTTPGEPFWEGPYEELPSSYIAHPGHLEWEGHVGEEEEEAPGPSAALALGSIAVVASVSVAARRRLTRAS